MRCIYKRKMNCLLQLSRSKFLTDFVKRIAPMDRLFSYEKFTHSRLDAKNSHDNVLMKSTKITYPAGSTQRIPFSSGQNPFSHRKNEEFMRYFPEFVDTLTSEKPWDTVPKLKEKLTKVLKCNVDLGTNARGVATVVAYEALERCENLTPENIGLANMLGWCVRMVESSVLTLDDIVDNSSTRGGKPCWFRNENVGLKAIIDGVYMENGVYYILKKYFSNHPQYLALVELFLDINFKISLGQSLDLVPCDLDDFTIDYYNLLVIGKAEYCFFYSPVVAAMLLANISDEELHRQVRPLLLSMGNYYQIQNDFLDCYGNPEETGKIGSDIREGKCSWLAVKAIEKANRTQRILMDENYGKDDDECIRIIHNLYNEMNLVDEYRRCKEQTHRNICSKISKLPENLPHELFYMFLDKVHNGKWGA